MKKIWIFSNFILLLLFDPVLRNTNVSKHLIATLYYSICKCMPSLPKLAKSFGIHISYERNQLVSVNFVERVKSCWSSERSFRWGYISGRILYFNLLSYFSYLIRIVGSHTVCYILRSAFSPQSLIMLPFGIIRAYDPDIWYQQWY